MEPYVLRETRRLNWLSPSCSRSISQAISLVGSYSLFPTTPRYPGRYPRSVMLTRFREPFSNSAS
eukprot:scaffold110413_cov28-Tisochrysis_lutea.AAC.4